MEHAVAESEQGSTPGQFAQVAGLAFSFDISQPVGSRVRSLVLTDANGNLTDIVAQNGEVVGNIDRTFRIVTLDFLADGGDDYPYPNFPTTDRVDLPAVMTEEQSGGQATFTAPGTEQDALAEYLAANFLTTPFAVVDVGPESDERIQNLAYRADSLIITPPSMSTFNMQLSAGLNMISLPLMSVEIRIYSQKGELVRSLKLGLQTAGYYVGKSRAAYWDGRNTSGELLASGVYFYQLITAESTTTRKMVIVK